ncbi:MAG: hypothetical protein U5J83_04050 [Bryobacterales bacterium]|nr:hypothetical protein [Bryobacterales bacterium]
MPSRRLRSLCGRWHQRVGGGNAEEKAGEGRREAENGQALILVADAHRNGQQHGECEDD